jgi:hypothetical protein
VSKYDLFRRRIAPIAFGIAIVFIARDMCNKHERTHATFVLTYGAAEPTVKTVDAELWMNGEQVSMFHRAALQGRIGSTHFTGSLPDTDGELRIDVELFSGDHRHAVHRVHVDEGATVTVPLELDLK